MADGDGPPACLVVSPATDVPLEHRLRSLGKLFHPPKEVQEDPRPFLVTSMGWDLEGDSLRSRGSCLLLGHSVVSVCSWVRGGDCSAAAGSCTILLAGVLPRAFLTTSNARVTDSHASMTNC